ncbi:hypothetical protein ANO11243_087030 [Dothideomycetidae sp. 11243]|nr:hypothetical protein ANO11243_087030 [fungal sp. No.11243]
MKSAVASAVLGAALLSSTSLAASIGHVHGANHVHRRAPTPAAVNEKRAVKFMTTEDVALIQSSGVLAGKNVAAAAGSTEAITVGQAGNAPFVAQLNNKSPNDLVAVVWAGAGQWGAVSATFVGAQQADVTHGLKSNTSTWISFNPANAAGNSLSGAISAVSADSGLSQYGQVDNTWIEYTLSTENQFSTTDVSRLINMNGQKVEVLNYPSKQAFEDNAAPACTGDNEHYAYVCSGGATTCIAGSMIGTDVGAAGNTADASGMDGGCSGMPTGGYMVINFY